MGAEGALAGAVVAFDLDGTLVDTAPDLLGTLNVLLAEECLPRLPLEEARPFIGRGARWLIERGFEAAGAHLHPAKAAALFDRFIAHYRAHIADASRPFPGLEGALDALAAAGATLSVCTNKPTGLSVALLQALGLAPRFAAIVGQDSVPAMKPDPGHLAAAVEAAGGTLGRAVLVGDSLTDATTARAAGAGLVLVDFGYSDVPAADLAPDALISHFDELPDAVMRLLPACGDGPQPL
jgi:phosphoglycolate phosphatase